MRAGTRLERLPLAARWVLVLLLTLLVCEVAARAALTLPSFRQRLRGTEQGRRLDAVLSWREGPALDAPHGGRLVHDPQLGWRLRPGSHTVLGAQVTVDAAGRRRTPPAPEGAARVVLLGDSFTHGDEVSDEETFAWRLGERGLDVRNHGVPGYGLDQAVLLLEADRLAAGADVVVLGLNTPTLVRTAVGWDTWRKPRFAPGTDGLEVVGVPVPPPEEAGRLWPLRTLDLLGVWAGLVRPTTPAPGLVTALLERARRSTEASGARLVVAWLPEPSLLADPDHVALPGEVAAWCEAQPCVDLRERLRTALDAGTPVERGAHWTPEAHALAAEGIAKALGR